MTRRSANFINGGTNRVILATDGDFNVGITDQDKLVSLIEAKAKSGVFLTRARLRHGQPQGRHARKARRQGERPLRLYRLARKRPARCFVEEIGATLVTIAKDVKIQVEFNPAKVGAYRLIGYENRLLRTQDFNDDTKDAGEIGAGHHVTALYELVPAGTEENEADGEPLKYRKKSAATPDLAASDESLTVKLRYKKPDGDTSTLIERGVVDKGLEYGQSSNDLKFASAVAGFGMLLRDSPHKGKMTYGQVLEEAENSLGQDPSGYRHEFLDLVRKALALKRPGQP